MVGKITDNGLLIRRVPIPGFNRLVPFDEITRVERCNGSDSRFIVHRVGGKPLVVKGASAENAREIIDGINEILSPSVSKHAHPLFNHEIDDIVQKLCGQKGARPSVLFRFLVDQALLHRATDIHFEYLNAAYQVRFRIDGLLTGVASVPETIRRRLIAHIKNSAGLASYHRDTPQEGRLRHEPDGQKPMEIRLSIVPAFGEESMVLRLFDALRGSLDLENLGFTPGIRKAYGEILECPRGLVLLSGPGNSGKTTTIYASLQYLMSGPRIGERAVSLEDPIEFPLDCATQIEILPRRGLTFDRMLSNVLRQDVEVISVGEIRDGDTAAIALRAALTGHLILSTVHCGSAAEVPRRLTDLGLGASEVAEAISGVLTQRLVRVICPRCRTETEISEAEREILRIPDFMDTAFRGAGCEFCLNTGYRGQTVVAELMKTGDELAEMIRRKEPVKNIRREAMRLGITDIRENAFEKAALGITTIEEIRRVLR